MAKKTDSAVKILASKTVGQLDKTGFNEKDYQDVVSEIAELAKYRSPNNRFEIAETIRFAVEETMALSEDFFNEIGEVKTISQGDTARFDVPQNEVTAYVQAKGGTPYRSKIFNKSFPVDTVEISARPYMNFHELATGRVNVAQLVASTAREMIAKKMLVIQDVLESQVKNLGAGAYLSESAFNAQSFRDLLIKFRRMGNVTILGDIAMLAKLNESVGYNGTAAPADAAQEEIRNYTYPGMYYGAKMVQFANPPIDRNLNPLLHFNTLYLLGGDQKSLKIANEGTLRQIEQTNADDESLEIFFRQDFGAALVVGKTPTLGAYVDTSR